jgi:hypothetical protein
LVGLAEAKGVLELRAQARHAQEMVEYNAKLQERAEKTQRTGKQPSGRPPQPPTPGARDKDQYNFTDPESRIMKTTNGFQQCYNAQAAVEVESRLVVGRQVSDAPNDKEQLAPTFAAIEPVAGAVRQVLVDSGFVSEQAVGEMEKGGTVQVLAAVKREKHGRRVEQLEKKADPPDPGPQAPFTERMAHRVATKAGRERYKLRQQTVEPVFGIIKEALGFRRFSLRGLAKANTEWTLVTMAYNLKRLFHMKVCLQTA